MNKIAGTTPTRQMRDEKELGMISLTCFHLFAPPPPKKSDNYFRRNRVAHQVPQRHALFKPPGLASMTAPIRTGATGNTRWPSVPACDRRT